MSRSLVSSTPEFAGHNAARKLQPCEWIAMGLEHTLVDAVIERHPAFGGSRLAGQHKLEREIVGRSRS